MIKITITKQGTVTNAASFPTMEEAQSWLSHHEGMKTFGTPSYTVEQQVELAPAVIDESGTEIVPALFETQTITVPGDYEVTIEDITSQLEQEAQKAEALKFLQDTDYKVLKYRDQIDMGRTPDLSFEEYQYLLVQRQAARDKA